MDFQLDDGINGAVNQDAPEMKSLARLLVQAELEKLCLVKELRVAAREVVQLAVRDAVRVVLDEIAGGNVMPTPPEQQGSLAPALNQVPPAVREPGGSASQEVFSVAPECQEYPPVIEPAGLYIYGVAAGEEAIQLDIAGINGCRVYTLVVAGLCAVVHDCPAEPYRPDNDEQAKGWLFDHQDVLDRAQEQLGVILPMGFNTVIHAAGRLPEDALREWLEQENSRLKEMLARLRDKEEFAVKILVAEEILKQEVLREDSGLQELKQELNGKPEGARYLYRERMEKGVRAALEDIGEIYFKKVYRTLHPLCADIHVEKTKRESPEKRMIANFSCLVEKNRVPELGEALAEIEGWEGFTVDFTGPWPPYSFVGDLVMPAKA